MFIDCVDSAWKPVSAYEQKKDYSVQGDVTDGTQGQLATWQIMPSSDAGHGNIIDVQYKNNGDYNAFIDIYTNSSAADMSAYATGKLVFDIKLTAAGSLSSALDVLLDCGYPCTSHDHRITPALNQWTTIEIPVSEFTDGGLNLGHVITGFQISPEWNKQNGVQFQLDNIRWVKGSGSLPAPVANCYEQRFETWNLGYHMEIFRGDSSLTDGALTQIIARSDMTPHWSAGTDMFGYVPHADSKFAPCAFTNGLLSAQVKLAKPYVTDGRMRVGLFYEDSLNHRAYFPATTAAQFTADIWKTISVPLVDANNAPLFFAADPEFNQRDIVNVGFYTDANGKPASAGGLIQVDNIFISGKPVTANVPNSSSSSSACSTAAQSYHGTNSLGFSIAANSRAYVVVSLTNATFTGSNVTLSSANTSSFVAQNTSDRYTFELDTSANGAASSEQLTANFTYTVINSSAAASVSIRLYSTLTDAINLNANALLSMSTTPLSAGALVCASSSSSRSSQSSAPASSSSKSSQSSAQVSSSSRSSSSSSLATSSSSRSSQASSVACAQTAQSITDSSPLGFGISAGQTVYISVKLNNATFTGAAPSFNAPNMVATPVFNAQNKAIFSVQVNVASPQSTVMQFSYAYLVTAAGNATSASYVMYSSPSGAVNELPSDMLSSTSHNLDSDSCH